MMRCSTSSFIFFAQCRLHHTIACYDISSVPPALKAAVYFEVSFKLRGSSALLHLRFLLRMFYSLIALGLILTSTFAAPTGSSDGCGKQLPKDVSPGGASYNHTLTSGDHERSYLIHLPQNYNSGSNKPAPLILSFHGRLRNSTRQEEISQFSNPTYNPNAIAVYPQGIKVSVL
jgi:hypothetical protein